MLAMAKTFEELFTPTLTGMADSFRYVSSTPVVLNTVLNNQLRHMKTNETIRNEENRRQ